MRKLILLLLILAILLVDPVETKRRKIKKALKKLRNYKEWKENVNKRFDPHEENFRQFVFEKNKAKMEEHNQKHTSTWKMELNEFAAMEFEEF